MPAPRHLIVTAANDLYLPLALGLLRSLRGLKFSIGFEIAVFDVGLSTESRAQLAAFGVRFAMPKVDIDYAGRAAWEAQMPAFRALTVRPFVRDYFPDYDAYIWIDADAWAQTPEAIDTMLAGAAGDDALWAAAEIDRDYAPFFLSSQPWQYYFDWYSANFSADQVAAIFPRPMLNAGIWALGADSPVWRRWAKIYTACMARVPEMTRQRMIIDQLSLNMAVYYHGLPLRVMPAEYNWLSLYALPMWDEVQEKFVRPTPPRSVISMLHLTHEKKLRTFEVTTVQGRTATMALMSNRS